MRRHALIVATMLVWPGHLPAQQRPALMPYPAQLELGTGRLRLDEGFTVALTHYADARLRDGVTRALVRLEARIARPISRTLLGGGPATLSIRVEGAGERVQGPDEIESYTLEVDADSALLAAPTVVGALRGLETLQQLIEGDSTGWSLPAVRISDAPRFRWRGLLIDAGRHFMPPEVVRRTLDGMAAVKLNVLHWHLSEDQGFRVESLRYPRLQQLGSDSLYYTQVQIREIVAYARDRGIRVVPEFDMPGHSTSWFVGYPQFASAPGPYSLIREFGVFEAAFDPTKEETYRFIDGFIGEMTTLFPDPYWHIGGDEVSPRQWNQNPRILRFRRLKGLPDNAALQAYFNQRLSRILTRHHRRMVGWDEILHPALPTSAVIQSWRGTEYLGRAALQGYSGILSAPFYLDHIDPADQHYLADPLPALAALPPEAAARVLGGEACMWAEHIDAETIDSRIWPRMAAIAERFWSPADRREVDDMYARLMPASIELERVGLGQETHTARMLRRVTGRLTVPPLQELLAVTMPVSFGERSRLQGTTQRTPLTSLIDAARPDPWARSQMNRLAREIVRDPDGATAARATLAAMFTAWQPLASELAALQDSIPLVSEGLPAAHALGDLAGLGLEALGRTGTARDDAETWRAAAHRRLTELAKPQGLLRLAGIDAVRILIDPDGSPPGPLP